MSRKRISVRLEDDTVVIRLRDLDLTIRVAPGAVVLRHKNVKKEAVYAATYRRIARKIYNELVDYAEEE